MPNANHQLPMEPQNKKSETENWKPESIVTIYLSLKCG